MKKIRYLPFGYDIVNGEIQIIPQEQQLLERIFCGYQQGYSLQKLSDLAERSGLKFRENARVWNKNMIARILDDERYWNGKEFPVILSMENAHQIAEMRKRKTTNQPVIRFLQKKVTCCHCGETLKRNSKNHPRIYWDCPGCGMRFGALSDEELLSALAWKLDWISKNPDRVEHKMIDTTCLSIQTVRLTNEINHMLGQRQVDQEYVISLIMTCAQEKYRECSLGKFDHITIKLKEIFQNHCERNLPTAELFEQTTETVILQTDNSIQLRLKNQKII